MRLNRIALPAAALLLLASCAGGGGTDGHEGHDHEDAAVGVTIWEGGIELFAEFHPPVLGETTGFVVHLTRLEDFVPLSDGTVTVTLRDAERIVASGEAERAGKTGIWTVEVPAPQPGEYMLAFSYDGSAAVAFEAGTVTAFGSEEEAAAFMDRPHEDDHDDDVETVAFLKEQQWNTEFLVERIERVRLRSSFRAVAEVTPRQSGHAEIISPVEGSLNIEHNREMAVPGKRVSPGDPLVTICQPTGVDGSWMERQLAYERAKLEFERAERLLAREAISQRDYDEIRRTWLAEKAGYETILRGVSAELVPDSAGEEIHIVLEAPLGGIVVSVGAMPGQAVAAGQRLMTIVDPSVVWLKADLFEKDHYRMGDPRGAEISVPGTGTPIRIPDGELKVLSGGTMFERSSMTIPVIFEVNNHGGLLKIGQVVQMEIFTGGEKDVVAVPEKSIVDEDYARYVFVQRGGETFEKRVVTTGARSGGLVEIVSGLEAGERVVTRGAYSVKLASSKRETGGAHVH